MQWNQTMNIWQPGLLMCTIACPQQKHLQITRAELEDYYDFINGPNISQKTPAPSHTTVLSAERNGWPCPQGFCLIQAARFVTRRVSEANTVNSSLTLRVLICVEYPN